MEFPKPIKAVWDFFVRIPTGIVLFTVIGLAAFVLNLITTFETVHQMLPSLMLKALELLTYLVFFIDVIVFVVFLVKEALRAIGLLSADQEEC